MAEGSAGQVPGKGGLRQQGGLRQKGRSNVHINVLFSSGRWIVTRQLLPQPMHIHTCLLRATILCPTLHEPENNFRGATGNREKRDEDVLDSR